ncbi:hypothetical protein GGX14DRAFT_453264, partial [Mycena pura]
MITVLGFLLVSVFVCPSSAVVALSVPSQINSGSSVGVKWQRGNSDPVAFDLVQYSDDTFNVAILAITPVNNSASENTGTASVLFDTPGQVTLGAFAQNTVSFATLENIPRQLTIISDNSSVAASAPHMNTAPTPTPPATPITGASTTVQIETHSSISAVSTGSSSVIPTFGPQSTNTTTGTTGALNAPQRGMSRATVIAVAVLLPLLILVIGILLYYCWRVRRYRDAPHRISKFTDVLLPVEHACRSMTAIASAELDSGAAHPSTGDPEPEAGAAVAVLVSGKGGRLRLGPVHLPVPATRLPALSPSVASGEGSGVHEELPPSYIS